MKHLALAALAFLAAGCTDADWAHLDLGDGGSGAYARPRAQSAATAPATARPAAPADQEEWCRRIAASARSEAAGQGFDAPTQERRADATYRQCVHYPGEIVR